MEKEKRVLTVVMVINKEEQRNIKQKQEGECRFALLFFGSKEQEARSKKQGARSKRQEAVETIGMG